MSRDPLYDDAIYNNTTLMIETIKNCLKLKKLPSGTMSISKCIKAPLTPKQGKGCLTRVLNTYQQQSLERLRLYIF